MKECGRSCDLAADVMGRALVLGALDDFEKALSHVRAPIRPTRRGRRKR